MDELARLVAAFLAGSVSLGVLVVVLLFLFPQQVQIWIAWFWRGVRLVTKRAEYRLVAAQVSAYFNKNLASELQQNIEGLTASGIRIRWDSSGESVAREKAGTVIVRMRPHDDRTLNVLHASLIATPRMIAPTIRGQLSSGQSKAIDYHLCRSLARRLGATATTVYKVELLDPELQAEPALHGILDQFETIELAGLFVPVFLQELVKLGASSPVDPLDRLEEEIHAFVDYLISIAKRGRGEDVTLSFLGEHIAINIMLVAKTETRSRGVAPYRSRAGIELAKGCRTIYVLSTSGNMEFANSVIDSLDSDMRFVKRRERRVRITRGGDRTEALVVPFDKNELYGSEAVYKASAEQAGLKKGALCDATVVDVRKSYVAISVEGVQGTIPQPEVDWDWVADCRDYVKVGEQIAVEILHVNARRMEVLASRKRASKSPVSGYQDGDLIGRAVEFNVRGSERRAVGSFLYGRVVDPPLPARLYETELQWGQPGRVKDYADRQAIATVVTGLNRTGGFVLCSHKRLGSERWKDIRVAYPAGKSLTATVTGVSSMGVFCELEPGLVGFVPAAEFRQAGLEYADFEANVAVGQKLYVVVARVTAGKKQRVTLRLQRNA